MAARPLRAQKYDEADRALCEAEQTVAETDERSHEAELLRHRGTLLSLSGNAADGFAKLWQAVEWARSRDARLFEVRALRDLIRLDIPEDQRKQAAAALHEVVTSFPENAHMPDLEEARNTLQRVKTSTRAI